MNKEKINGWQKLHDAFIIGEADNEHFQHRYACFLREFATQPEAEILRRRCRYLFVLSFLVTTFLTLAGIIPFNEIAFSWISTIYLTLSYIVPNHDIYFVRLWMKRRARLEARNHPNLAEKLLWFWLPPETADEAIDDLNTKFMQRKVRFGTTFARNWYWWQIARSLSPKLDQLIEKVIKWGIIEWIRRQIF